MGKIQGTYRREIYGGGTQRSYEGGRTEKIYSRDLLEKDTGRRIYKRHIEEKHTRDIQKKNICMGDLHGTHRRGI